MVMFVIWLLFALSCLVLIASIAQRVYFSPARIDTRAKKTVARIRGKSFAYIDAVIENDKQLRCGLVSPEQYVANCMQIARQFPDDSGLTELLAQEEFSDLP